MTNFWIKQIGDYLKNIGDSLNSHTSIPTSLQKTRISKDHKFDDPKIINIGHAKKIILPVEEMVENKHVSDSYRYDMGYCEKYHKAYSYYKRKWYKKSKEEFLQISDLYKNSTPCLTHLARAYRKIIEKYLAKKDYYNAFSEISEMFINCPNVTNADVKRYNAIIDEIKCKDPLFEKPKKELNVDLEPEYVIKSDFIKYLSDRKKHRGMKIPNDKTNSYLKLIKLSNFVPTSLPYLLFDNSKIEYTSLANYSELKHDVYRFRESVNKNAFIASSKGLDLYLYDWEFNLLHSTVVSKYSSGYTHLRRIDLSGDLTCFLFTNIDKAYLLDSQFNIIHSYQVPHKEGWEKRKTDSPHDNEEQNKAIQKHMQILNLDGEPSPKEIKSAYRKQALKHHPDKNIGDPLAESKMKQIIESYEYLTGDDPRNAFKGLENEEYWVKTIDSFKIEISGMTFEINYSIGGTGEDWIYGSGMSNDGSRIYLGCYSGKTYQIDKNGCAKKIYVIPEQKVGEYSMSIPISYVLELEDYLHILAEKNLYILKNDVFLKNLNIEKKKVKWFDGGFLMLFHKSIDLYSNNGISIGSINLKYPIKQVCYKEKILLIETSRKSFIFRLDIA